MSQLLLFYCGTHPDHKGRTLAEILKQDDLWLELTHDYIQWLFPLTDLSSASVHAPLLDHTTVKAFAQDEQLRSHMRAAFVRMLNFFGLRITRDGITKGDNWSDRKTEWFTEPTHNSLRLTRMMKSLHALGFTWEARVLQSTLANLCDTEPDCGVDEAARRFWRDAIPTT